jgi:hypothetical protein
MIDAWVYPVVLVGLLALGAIVDVLIRHAAPKQSMGRAHGLATLVLGDDGRASTSKLQATLWTLAILWALVALLAGAGVDAFAKALGGEHLREEYLLLLGGPFAAAIAAKAVTTRQTLDDPGAKPHKPADLPSGLAARLTEVFTNDDGSVDLGDLQYTAFTIVALAYFAWAFINDPAQGLPAIPGTLLVLVGVSQATYVGKKALLPPQRPGAKARAHAAGSTEPPPQDSEKS